jgi:hypothetical protein
MHARQIDGEREGMPKGTNPAGFDVPGARDGLPERAADAHGRRCRHRPGSDHRGFARLADLDSALSYILPPCGKPVCLTEDRSPFEAGRAEFRGTMETPFAEALRTRLMNSGHPWSLIVFDPMSRFAGPNAEVDNAAATRFIQALERFAEVPGTPTVLVAHHTSKMSRSNNAELGASAARGASALTDGVRWQANLEPLPSAEDDKLARFVELRVTKSNYAMFPDPVTLVRDPDAHGALRAANAQELGDYAGAVENAAIETVVKKKEDAAKVKERVAAKRAPAPKAANQDAETDAVPIDVEEFSL